MISNAANLLRRRDLLRELVRSELAASSAQSRFGWLWWLIDPLLMMLIYWGIVELIRGGGKPMYSPYPVFILCALICWKHFSGAAARTTRVLSSREALIKSVPFPTMVLPLAQIISGFTFFLFSFGLLLAMVALMASLGKMEHHSGHWLPLIQVPGLMVMQIVVVAGICLPLSCVAVLFKDLSGLMTHITRIGFYLSPGLYGVDRIQALATKHGGHVGPLLFALYMFNPFALLITGYRDAVFYGQFMEPHYWVALIVESLFIFVVGYLIYQHYDRRVIKFL